MGVRYIVDYAIVFEWTAAEFAKQITAKWMTTEIGKILMYLIKRIQVATRSISPDMKTVLLARSYSRFSEIKSILIRKKIKQIKAAILPGTSFSSRDNLRANVTF